MRYRPTGDPACCSRNEGDCDRSLGRNAQGRHQSGVTGFLGPECQVAPRAGRRPVDPDTRSCGLGPFRKVLPPNRQAVNDSRLRASYRWVGRSRRDHRAMAGRQADMARGARTSNFQFRTTSPFYGQPKTLAGIGRGDSVAVRILCGRKDLLSVYDHADSGGRADIIAQHPVLFAG